MKEQLWCCTAQPEDVGDMLLPLPQSFFQGLPPAQIMAQGGFPSSREQRFCPTIHVPSQHPLQEMFPSRAHRCPAGSIPVCRDTLLGDLF